MYMEKVSMGTTILAIECTDGVVIASDSRTSSGSFIASRATNKITEISPQIYLARCGAAADTQALARYSKYFLNALSINSDRPFERSVQIVANTVRKLIQGNKKRLSAGILCCGYDETNGPQVYSIDVSGMALRRTIAMNGSGSSYIMAYIDSHYQEGEDGKPIWTMEEATKFAVNCITGAIVRDGSSGGVVNLVHVNAEGSKRFTVRPAQQPFNQDIVKT